MLHPSYTKTNIKSTIFAKADPDPDPKVFDQIRNIVDQNYKTVKRFAETDFMHAVRIRNYHDIVNEDVDQDSSVAQRDQRASVYLAAVPVSTIHRITELFLGAQRWVDIHREEFDYHVKCGDMEALTNACDVRFDYELYRSYQETRLAICKYVEKLIKGRYVLPDQFLSTLMRYPYERFKDFESIAVSMAIGEWMMMRDVRLDYDRQLHKGQISKMLHDQKTELYLNRCLSFRAFDMVNTSMHDTNFTRYLESLYRLTFVYPIPKKYRWEYVHIQKHGPGPGQNRVRIPSPSNKEDLVNFVVSKLLLKNRKNASSLDHIIAETNADMTLDDSKAVKNAVLRRIVMHNKKKIRIKNCRLNSRVVYYCVGPTLAQTRTIDCPDCN